MFFTLEGIVILILMVLLIGVLIGVRTSRNH